MPLTQVIGFTEPFKATQQFYVGLTFGRTATGSGLGTESAVGQTIPTRTATGSGVGGFDSTGLVTRVRQGSDSAGTGSSSSARIILRSRTATGSGLGTESSYGSKSSLRTASGSGTGSETASKIRTVLRTATGSGASDGTGLGIRVYLVSATGSGQGSTSGNATFYKFHMFRPPTAFDGPTTLVGGDRVANRLARFYRPRERGINVYKLVDSTFTQVDQSDYTNISKVYHGGHIHQLTEEEYADLLGAGYGAYLT